MLMPAGAERNVSAGATSAMPVACTMHNSMINTSKTEF